MKVVFYPLLLALLLFISSAQANAQAPSIYDTLFTIKDAEKVLGEAVHFTKGKTNSKTFSSVYQATYTANAKDKKSGITGELVYQLEMYKSDTGARRKYQDIKRNNDKGDGVEALPGIGDEAYSYTDGETFYIIMGRKGSVLFRIRVEKMTTNFSIDAIEEVVEDISDRI